jgi:hypothetical protein
MYSEKASNDEEKLKRYYLISIGHGYFLKDSEVSPEEGESDMESDRE